VPQGYICSSVADLSAAYRLLLASHNSGTASTNTPNSQQQQQQQVAVLLKSLFAGGEGEGLLVVSDEEQLLLYDFHDSEQVVLQELLTLDRWVGSHWTGGWGHTGQVGGVTLDRWVGFDCKLTAQEHVGCMLAEYRLLILLLKRKARLAASTNQKLDAVNMVF
jgi:hypothetical protein